MRTTQLENKIEQTHTKRNVYNLEKSRNPVPPEIDDSKRQFKWSSRWLQDRTE